MSDLEGQSLRFTKPFGKLLKKQAKKYQTGDKQTEARREGDK